MHICKDMTSTITIFHNVNQEHPSMRDPQVFEGNFQNNSQFFYLYPNQCMYYLSSTCDGELYRSNCLAVKYLEVKKYMTSKISRALELRLRIHRASPSSITWCLGIPSIINTRGSHNLQISASCIKVPTTGIPPANV